MRIFLHLLQNLTEKTIQLDEILSKFATESIQYIVT